MPTERRPCAKTVRETPQDGVIIFTPAHRMIAFVVEQGRTPAKNDAESLKLFQSMAAYTGKFVLEPGKYTVNLDFTSSQIALDEPQVRRYRIEGDALIIETPEHDILFAPGKQNSTLLKAVQEK